jgi:transcriptional regulator with XRE-family HTH domain
MLAIYSRGGQMVKVKLNRRFVDLLLARRNMSQNALAKSLGLSSGYLAQLMNGDRHPSPQLRQRMLDVLNPLSFDDLFIVEHSHKGPEDNGHRAG